VTDSGLRERFESALRLMDAANGEDPRREFHKGEPQPRELLFSLRTYHWIPRLIDQPSEALLLATRGHTLRRWRIPRDRFPMTNPGYHEWRDSLAAFHAEQTADLLRQVGYEEAVLERVRALIIRKLWPADPEARALEDADCLAFLELKLAGYAADWGEEKTVNILRGTWGKMTPRARELALDLPLARREMQLLAKATS
jgi:hypothetical protein